MAATLDAITNAFNANYKRLAGANATVTLVKDTMYKAVAKTQSVEFDIPASTSNMQLVTVTEPPAGKLWRLVNV